MNKTKAEIEAYLNQTHSKLQELRYQIFGKEDPEKNNKLFNDILDAEYYAMLSYDKIASLSQEQFDDLVKQYALHPRKS